MIFFATNLDLNALYLTKVFVFGLKISLINLQVVHYDMHLPTRLKELRACKGKVALHARSTG